MNVQHLGLNTQQLGTFFHFRSSTVGQWPTGRLPMPDVSVGNRYEFELMTLFDPQSGTAGDLEFTVVRVSAEADDMQSIFGGGRLGALQRTHAAGPAD